MLKSELNQIGIMIWIMDHEMGCAWITVNWPELENNLNLAE